MVIHLAKKPCCRDGVICAISSLTRWLESFPSQGLLFSCCHFSISNIAAVVFEARNDYNIHKEKLKTGELLSIQNYSSYFLVLM